MSVKTGKIGKVDVQSAAYFQKWKRGTKDVHIELSRWIPTGYNASLSSETNFKYLLEEVILGLKIEFVAYTEIDLRIFSSRLASGHL